MSRAWTMVSVWAVKFSGGWSEVDPLGNRTDWRMVAWLHFRANPIDGSVQKYQSDREDERYRRHLSRLSAMR